MRRVHPLTKLLGLAWAAIVGVLAAGYGGIAAAAPLSLALVNYNGGVVSPVSVLGGITLLWVVLDWRISSARRLRENKAIIQDKPALAHNKRGLARERRIREKEMKLQKREEKALRAENRAEKRIARDGRRENALERKRENIALKKEALQEREGLRRR